MTLTLTKQEKRMGGVYLLLHMLVVPVVVSVLCVLLGITSLSAVNLIYFFLNAALALVFFRALLRQSIQNCAGRWGHTIWTAVKGFGLYWLLKIGRASCRERV